MQIDVTRTGARLSESVAYTARGVLDLTRRRLIGREQQTIRLETITAVEAVRADSAEGAPTWHVELRLRDGNQVQLFRGGIDGAATIQEAAPTLRAFISQELR